MQPTALPGRFYHVVAAHCIIKVSRQYSKELAERQILFDLDGREPNALLDKMCTQELTIDEEGIIRVVEEMPDTL